MNIKKLFSVSKVSRSSCSNLGGDNYSCLNFLRTITMEKSVITYLSERLSPFVKPTNYKLLLHPNLETGLFQGNVQIDVIVNEVKNYLCLHTKYLNINNVTVCKGNLEIPVAKYLEEKKLEQLFIQFDRELCSGNYQITIDFDGDLTKAFVGFYLSRLSDNRNMVASKFEPTYARQAFPCFDEPDFKATYDITLVKPFEYIALSNMNEVSKKPYGKNLEAVNFATSVPMSTYLACFVICDFDFKETKINANGIGKDFILRLFAQKHQTHKIDFAQDIGKRATEFYIKYYEVPFPLPKLDMIAIPDYVSGATEHWGLITYRETAFLIDESKASAENKISVANTIAHELAHMWFGNLVTMKWWDDLWLNEGFATYMQVKALNSLEPSWTMLDQFLTMILHSVLVTDAKESSHPIVQTVNTPDQITAIFDSITYSKGSSILRMLEGFIGEENFRLGVSEYLKKHEFGNTVTQDLLSVLEKYARKNHHDQNLGYIMDTWTRQKGYPVLTVSRGPDKKTFNVEQRRFLYDVDAIPAMDSPYNYRWVVPVTYTTNKGAYSDVIWFSDKADRIQIKLKDDETWFKLNNKQVGYYRVNYTIEIWKDLIEQLENMAEPLTISDRAHLLNDVFALADAQQVPYITALDLTTYLRKEEDLVPWRTASTIFSGLRKKLSNSTAYDDLLTYLQYQVKPLYKKQSWEKPDLPVIKTLLRSEILQFAAACELQDAMKKIRTMFHQWLKSHDTGNPIKIETDLRSLVYYYGMETATIEEWEKVWKIYLQEEDAQELGKLRRALAAPRDTDILRGYVNLAWDERNVRSQDYLNVLQFISRNPSGTALIWDDVRRRWPKLVEKFTLNSRYLGALIPSITETFNTECKLHEMEAFFSKYPEAGAGEIHRKSALENVRNNIRWTSANFETVATWLKVRKY